MSIAEKLTTVAENVPKVYEAGQKSEYDKFWDIYQDNGNRTHYNYAFAGTGWTKETFKPKYDIVPTSLYCGFTGFDFKGSLTEALEEQGVILDLSQATQVTNLFNAASGITEIPHIDLSGVTSSSVNGVFFGCTSLITIEKVTIPSTITSFSTFFQTCNSLENVEIAGTIAGNGLNLQWSTKLTVASLLSILTALSKDSTVASGKSITLATDHQAVIESNAECLEQYNLAISAGWTIAFA